MQRMSIPFRTKMAALLAKTGPEQIYAYKPGKLITVGSYALSLTFALYGASFADWSLATSNDLYKKESELPEEAKKELKWYENASLLFLGRSVGTTLLSVIPFTLAAAALYMPTRIVTKLHYIPDQIPKCKVTTRSLFGRSKETVLPLRSLRRNEKTRVFTGVGEQGVEDRGSFSFFLTDKNGSLFNKFYIVNRSGKFWGSDGRFIDALFGGESITDLELKQFKGKKPDYEKNEQKLEQLIQQEVSRPRLKSSKNVKNIIMNSKASTSEKTHQKQ